MGLNQTPSAERRHIGFFGRRNAGKSSVVNAVTGQQLSIVSDIKGTTTDPVSKTMELLPIGPVVIIDTPGIDDTGELGEERIRRTYQVMNKTDIALLIVDGTKGMDDYDRKLVAMLKEKNIPYQIVYNKCDLVNGGYEAADPENVIRVSARTGQGIEELKNRIGKLADTKETERKIVSDLIKRGDLIVLVVPIDESAPKGRLILPQQQTIRDILDAGAVAVVVKDTELRDSLQSLGKKPAMVITDSQVFGTVSKVVPEDIPLTSFSILFARYKGNLGLAVEGVRVLEKLKEGDRILISEGCTHHRQCNDIGAVKIPNWIEEYTGKHFKYSWTSGGEFPEDLGEYQLVIHCGGCMLSEREMRYRYRHAGDQEIPMTNYGILIAGMKGILARSTRIFPGILE